METVTCLLKELELKNVEPQNSQLDLSFLTDQRIEEEPLKIHCPHCLKSFKLAKQSIKSKRPQFKCPSCTHGFWFHNVGSLAKTSIMAFPMEWLHHAPEETTVAPKKPIEVSTKSCPACGNKIASTMAECTFCGILFKRHELLRENADQFKVSAKTRKHWDRVIGAYEDEPRHYDFIRSCAEDGALDYAAQRYKRLSEAIPHDSVSSKMLLFIEQLATMKVSTKGFGGTEKRWGTSWLNAVILLATIVIAMGIMFPGQKNLVGLGSLALFFVMTMKLMQRV